MSTIRSIDGTFAFDLSVGETTVRVTRGLDVTRDIDGSWIIGASCPDEGGPDSRYGMITVSDPTVTGVIDRLLQLLADPGSEPFATGGLMIEAPVQKAATESGEGHTS